MLERAGLDPTAVIGGRLSAFGSNARLGQGEYMVAEADESDRSFLKLSPSIAVITNIDREHLDAYGSFDRLVDAFVDFAGRVPFYGAVVACVDDRAGARRCCRGSSAARSPTDSPSRRTCRGHSRPCPTAGRRAARCGTRFAACRVAPAKATSRCKVPGLHNLQNALAAVAVGLELGVPFGRIAAALAEFRGAERRYEVRGSVGGVTVVDDYGHHPTEIAAVLRAARVRQPDADRRRVSAASLHAARAICSATSVRRCRWPMSWCSRTSTPAGEAPIPGATLEALAAAIRPHVRDLHVVPGLGGRARARAPRWRARAISC